MSPIVGSYVHERNENLEEFYKALGILFIPRKMMLASHPSLQVTVNEEGEWSISVITLINTHVTKFKLGEEYEDTMPVNTLIKKRSAGTKCAFRYMGDPLASLRKYTVCIMSFIVGNYQHEKNENLEEFYKAAGVPFIPRKMMLASHPSMQVTVNEVGEWSITTVTLVRTHLTKFKLGEEYEETMPGNVVIKNITTREENKLLTVSTGPDGKRSLRTHEFSETGVVITLKHEPTGVEAKRYFKRV